MKSFIISKRKLLLLSCLGGVLEFYDFIIYALLASYLSVNFYPVHNSLISLIGVFATFSVGYLVRPLGGIIFGHFGDKQGRKKTFTFSILMMALGTLAIALLPTYGMVGLIAPISLTLLRIIQGISVGGEIPGAIAFVSESMPETKGLACGVIFFALVNGIVLGSLILAVLQTSLSANAMLVWGWRVPFAIGGFLGLGSYWMRRQIEEPTMFTKIESNVSSIPLFDVLKHARLNCMLGCFLIGANGAVTTLLFLFMPSYISEVLHIQAGNYMWWNTLALLVVSVLCIIVGSMSDYLSHKKLFLIAIMMSLLFAMPIFIIYTHYFSFYIFALLLSALLAGIYGGIVPSIMPELFETRYRYSGIAVSYNIGFALFAGLAPLISMLVIKCTGMTIAPAFYIMAISFLAGISVFFIKTTKLNSDFSSCDFTTSDERQNSPAGVISEALIQ